MGKITNLKKFEQKSAPCQLLNLKNIFNGEGKAQHDNFLVWEGIVKPTDDSINYLLCLNYNVSDKPRIWVVNPPFYKDTVNRFPHVYLGNQLCLYDPANWKWHASEWLADTILPWACLWLYYYEIYQINGQEWLGGGRHPHRRKNSLRKKKPIKCVRLHEV